MWHCHCACLCFPRHRCQASQKEAFFCQLIDQVCELTPCRSACVENAVAVWAGGLSRQVSGHGLHLPAPCFCQVRTRQAGLVHAPSVRQKGRWQSTARGRGERLERKSGRAEPVGIAFRRSRHVSCSWESEPANCPEPVPTNCRLLEGSVQTSPEPFWFLVPTVPSSGSEAWWHRVDGEPSELCLSVPSEELRGTAAVMKLRAESNFLLQKQVRQAPAVFTKMRARKEGWVTCGGCRTFGNNRDGHPFHVGKVLKFVSLALL